MLRDNFTRELERAINRLNEALAPYRRFIRSEEEQLELRLKDLDQIALEINSMRVEVDPE